MKKILYILLIGLGFYQLNSKPLQLEIDAAQFKYNEDETVWEMYYSFPDTTMKYIFQDGKYIGEMFFSVEISSAVQVVDKKEWIVSYPVDSVPKHFKMNLTGQKNFVLPAGQYTVKVSVRDYYDSITQAKTEFTLIAKKFPVNSLSISEIQLSQLIENASEKPYQTNQSFKKNSLYVVPVPNLEIAGTEPVLYTYLEVYNSKSFSPDSFYVNYRIFDNLKNEVLFYRKERFSFSDGLVETQAFPVEGYPSGLYYIMATLGSIQNSKDSISAIKKFYIVNPYQAPQKVELFTESIVFERSEFSTMTIEQIDKEYAMAKYIATDQEKDLFDELLTVEAKQKFMFTFWKSRDIDTIPGINSKLDEYRKNIDYANRFFSYGRMRDGWKTDRGRVILKYGEPTQRTFTAANADNRGYEEWFYGEQQGGIYFYFVDFNQFGNFNLVHSTAWGENKNENWYNQYIPIMNNDANNNFNESNESNR